MRKQGNRLTANIISKLLTNLRNRWRLHFTSFDIFQLSYKGFYDFFRCREFQSKKKKLLNDLKDKIFQKGSERVLKELDCVALLQRMR